MIDLGWIQDEGKLNENTYLIDSGLFGGEHNMACFLIEGKRSKVLIDASGKMEGKKIAKKLVALNKIPDKLILTHAHWDHAGGTNKILKQFPDMEVMASVYGIESLKNAREFNKWFSDVTPVLKPVENVTPLKDGTVIDIGGLELEIFETPGHTNCSLSILDRKNKSLFIGDALGYKYGSEVFLGPVMPPEYSEATLMKTYEKIKAINYESVCMAHYGMLTDDLARDLPDYAKENHLFWKDFTLARWKENPTKEYLINAFNEKFIIPDISPEKKYGIASLYGNFYVDGLQTANLI